MGMHHIDDFGELLQAEVGGKYYVSVNKTVDRNGVPTQYQFNMMRRKDRNFCGGFSASPMPGCCGIIVFHNLRNGYGKIDLLHNLIMLGEEAAIKAKYGLVLMSVRAENPLVNTLTPLDIVHGFRNGKTNHMVNLIGFDLKQPEKVENTHVPLED